MRLRREGHIETVTTVGIGIMLLAMLRVDYLLHYCIESESSSASVRSIHASTIRPCVPMFWSQTSTSLEWCCYTHRALCEDDCALPYFGIEVRADGLGYTSRCCYTNYCVYCPQSPPRNISAAFSAPLRIDTFIRTTGDEADDRSCHVLMTTP